MGLGLEEATLTWEEVDAEMEELYRQRAAKQFRQHLTNSHRFTACPPTWGDELEHYLVMFDHQKKSVKLHMNNLAYLSYLPSNWSLEGFQFQLESQPRNPYSPTLTSILEVMTDMEARRTQLKDVMSDMGTDTMTIGAFPRLFTPDFVFPEMVNRNSFVNIEMISTGNERYKSLAKNLFFRGIGSEISIPIFQDVETVESEVKITDAYHVCATQCSLQANVQARDLEEARNMYDQFAALAPVLIALTASAPSFGGYLLKTDSRLGIFARNGANDKTGLPHRLCSIRTYIGRNSQHLNNVYLQKHEETLAELQDANIDEELANHVAEIVNYQPILVTQRPTNNEARVMNGNVYRTVKLKLPEQNNGWIVELRAMDAQPTDFQNSAFVSFVYLLWRTILHFGLDFRIPVTELNTNYENSMEMDAVKDVLFDFKCSSRSLVKGKIIQYQESIPAEAIINGNDHFPGLIKMIDEYLTIVRMEEEDLDIVQKLGSVTQTYLNFISSRASGSAPTYAQWARSFVVGHRSYHHDSVVSEEIQYDLLMKTCQPSNFNTEFGVEASDIHTANGIHSDIST